MNAHFRGNVCLCSLIGDSPIAHLECSDPGPSHRQLGKVLHRNRTHLQVFALPQRGGSDDSVHEDSWGQW